MVKKKNLNFTNNPKKESVRNRQVIMESDFLNYIKKIIEKTQNGHRIEIDVISDNRNFLVLPDNIFLETINTKDMLPYKALITHIKGLECFINIKSRKSKYVLERYAYYHIIRSYYGTTFMKIAKDLNNSHCTVIHGCKTVNNFLQIKYQRFLKIYSQALINSKILIADLNDIL